MFHHFHMFVPSLFGLVAMIFWIWMLVDCARNPRLRGGAKVVWLLVVFFLNWLGALIYFFAGRARNQTTFIHSRSQWYGHQPYQQPNQQPIYYQPTPPQTDYQPSSPPTNEAYRGYQEGYGVVPAQYQQQAEEISNWHHYEEPQSSYPQLPQQELPPQSQQ